MSNYYFAQNADSHYLICAATRDEALEIATGELHLDLFDEETGEGYTIVKTERADLTAAEARSAAGAPVITHYKAQFAPFNTHAQIRSKRGEHEVEAVRCGARQIKTFTSLKAAKSWLRSWFEFGNLKQIDC